MKKYLLLIIFVSFFVKTSFSQTDKDFWFVAPEVAQAAQDRPIFLRMSTVGLASTVTISQPANAGFIPIVVNIPANSTVSQDLTSRITMIESGSPTPGLVENKGLHIVATQNITAYYEVLGTGVVTWVSPYNGQTRVLNSDIFALKGKNALGTRFYTPFQNQLPNCNNNIGTSVVAYSAFDIVATVDNTVITITPTQDVYRTATTWRTAGTAYTVTLNRGQTYSGRARSQSGAGHLSGTLITSNNPIAVTIKDDSILQNMSMDLAGDQLVPVNVIGTEYIVIKGNVNTNGTALGDRAIIVATQANTTVTIGGVLRATLNAGQTLNWQVTQASEYIVTSQPAYVFHLSGFGDELGGALLPPVVCTGSRQVNIFRDTSEPFYLNLLVRAGGQGNFTIKNSSTGATTAIPAGSFTIVPNTANQWLEAHILYTTAVIPTGSSNLISNSTADFHAGFMNGDITEAGCRYGYFSDFGSLAGGVATAATSPICEGSSTTIKLTGSVGNMQWQQSANGVNGWVNAIGGSGDTTTTYTTPNLTDTIYYRALLSSGTCISVNSTIATVIVHSPTVGGIVTTATDTICTNSTATITVSGYRGIIQWQQSADGSSGSWANIAGATNATYTTPVLTPGPIYYRTLVTNGSCASQNSDSVKISVSPLSMGGTASAAKSPICVNDSSSITVTGYTGSIQWEQSPSPGVWVNVTGGSGATSATYNTPKLSGTMYYRAKITSGGCSSENSDTATVVVNKPVVTGFSTAAPDTICYNSITTVTVNGNPVGSLQWQQSGDTTVANNWVNVIGGSGATTTTYTTPPLTTKIYYREVVTIGGCASSTSTTATITVNPRSKGGVAVAAKSPICSGASTTVSITGNTGNSIQWQQSANGSSGWVNVTGGSGGATATYTTPNLSSTVYYRAVVKSGVCALANSSVASITIYTPSVGGKAAGPVDVVCYNSTTKVTLTGYNGIVQWEQSNDTTIASNWVNIPGASADVLITSNLQAETYYRAIVINGGCSSAISNIVTVKVRPKIEFILRGDSLICEGTEFFITAQPGFTDYQWQDDTKGPQFLVIQPGTYIVKAVAPNGCMVSDTVVISGCNRNFIPNIITPNKDGKNDCFVIQGIVPNSSLAIYNRWGTLIYSKASYDNSWDGGGATDGLYYYIYHKNGEAPIPGWLEILKSGN